MLRMDAVCTQVRWSFLWEFCRTCMTNFGRRLSNVTLSSSPWDISIKTARDYNVPFKWIFRHFLHRRVSCSHRQLMALKYIWWEMHYLGWKLQTIRRSSTFSWNIELQLNFGTKGSVRYLTRGTILYRFMRLHRWLIEKWTWIFLQLWRF